MFRRKLLTMKGSGTQLAVPLNKLGRLGVYYCYINPITNYYLRISLSSWTVSLGKLQPTVFIDKLFGSTISMC